MEHAKTNVQSSVVSAVSVLACFIMESVPVRSSFLGFVSGIEEVGVVLMSCCCLVVRVGLLVIEWVSESMVNLYDVLRVCVALCCFGFLLVWLQDPMIALWLQRNSTV